MKYLFSFVLIFCITGFINSQGRVPLERGFAGTPLEARQKVIEAAKKYQNTPYLYGGITRNGLDCSGFIYVSFRDALGVSLPRSTINLYSWVEIISLDKTQPGDLLFFKTDNSGNITHVGLFLGDGQFIHSASAGANTGVIISNLSELYWARAYANAGRVLPETGYNTGTNTGINNNPTDVSGKPDVPGIQNTGTASAGNRGFVFSFGFAPSWNLILPDENLVRGYSSQIRLGYGSLFNYGVEIRPEYDGILGVFRLPVTLSFEYNEKINIFLGPVFSFGDAVISVESEDDDELYERYYSGGTSWCGAAGIMLTPFTIKTKIGGFAPYFELAWQYYFSNDAERNFNADLIAISRFSTGLKWTKRLSGRH
jgi:probable lipoprotein NlpC